MPKSAINLHKVLGCSRNIHISFHMNIITHLNLLADDHYESQVFFIKAIYGTALSACLACFTINLPLV